MQQKESYDVLRLIEHGQICYISSENVKNTCQIFEVSSGNGEEGNVPVVKGNCRTAGTDP